MYIFTDSPNRTEQLFSREFRWNNRNNDEIINNDYDQLVSQLLKNPSFTEMKTGLDWHSLIHTKHSPVSQFDSLNNFVKVGLELPDGILCHADSGQNFHGQGNRKWEAKRGNIHLSVFFSPKFSLEKMNRVLDDGGILGLVSDQDAKNRGVFVRFFNILSSTPKGAAQFYQHKGSVPIFGVCSKEGHNQFLIKFKPIPKGSLADTETFTQAYTQLLENEIRIHPEQYFWWHNRWKTSPQEK